jgi:hypothetical protein
VQENTGDSPPPQKRTKSHGKTGNERRNAKRITAGEGLANVADSMQAAMTTLATSIATASSGSALTARGPTTVDPKTAAIEAIEQDEGLSDNEFIEVVEMVMNHSDAARVYLAIKAPAARTRFLRSQLNKIQNSQ